LTSCAHKGPINSGFQLNFVGEGGISLKYSDWKVDQLEIQRFEQMTKRKTLVEKEERNPGILKLSKDGEEEGGG